MSENIVNGNYIPSFPPERNFYEGLWKYANPTGGDTLPGNAAVPFFQKSEVDKGILRQIWSLSAPSNIMKKENFFTAIRFITMVQNGDIPISTEKLISSANTQLPPPKFTGVQLPPAPGPGGPPGQLPPPQAYAVSPDERTKYEGLFKTYDKDKTGFLPQAQIMPVFMKSGLDTQLLNAVWHMSDHDKDGRLNLPEFIVAFHLILCISKKRLPLPPGLPPPLLALFQPAPPASTQQPPVSTPSPVPVKQSVSDAFGDVEDDVSVGSATGSLGGSLGGSTAGSFHSAPSAHKDRAPVPAANATQPHHTHQSGGGVQHGHSSSLPSPSSTTSGPATWGRSDSVKDKEQGELTDGVQQLADAAKRMHSAQQDAMEISHGMGGNLKYLMQRVATEKISLTAALGTVEQDVQETRERIQSTVDDINGLQDEMEELRKRLLAAYEAKSKAQNDDSQARAEKQRLMTVIAEGRRELAALVGEQVHASNLLGQMGEQVAAAAAENARLASASASASMETAVLTAELETLRNVLASINEDKEHASSSVKKLEHSLTEARGALEKERKAAADRSMELAAVEAENQRLRDEISATMKDLALAKAVAASTPMQKPTTAPPPVPVRPSSPLAQKAAPVKGKSFQDDNMSTASTGFGGSSVNGGMDDDAFSGVSGSFSNQNVGKDNAFGGEDGFGSTTGSDFGSTAGSAFAESTASPKQETQFEALDETGFDDFGSNKNDDGFSAGSGFGDFGATDATNPDSNSGFEESSAKAGDHGFGAADSGFGDFGDSSNTAADSGFGDAGFGSTTDSGFGDFGENSSKAADSGFGDFGESSPKAADAGFGSADDGFGSTADSGFGDFGDNKTVDSAFGSADGSGFGDFGGSSTKAADDGFGTAASADSGFGDFGDDSSSKPADEGFGDFGSAASTENAASTEKPDAGFGSFGDDSSAAASGGDGFAAFGDSTPTPASNGDGFGAFPDSGFGAFEDTAGATPSGDAGFASFGDDSGFGAFGDAPADSGDGFGAFDDSSNKSKGFDDW
mmetsp:Transcript_2695/g.4048  ORF Transcript_2695/g.4048 Transcript_2695/m.4048 type:complete len:1026 (-) Transcript_2695:127-3204(-)